MRAGRRSRVGVRPPTSTNATAAVNIRHTITGAKQPRAHARARAGAHTFGPRAAAARAARRQNVTQKSGPHSSVATLQGGCAQLSFSCFKQRPAALFLLFCHALFVAKRESVLRARCSHRLTPGRSPWPPSWRRRRPSWRRPEVRAEGGGMRGMRKCSMPPSVHRTGTLGELQDEPEPRGRAQSECALV